MISIRVLSSILLFATLLPALGHAQEEADGPKVAASAICLGVEKHEPVDAGTSFPVSVGQLYCWTRIVDAADQTIVHAWIHEGTTRARVELKIGSPSWRTYSSKKLLPGWTGRWEVKVMTLDGRVLETIGFTVEAGDGS